MSEILKKLLRKFKQFPQYFLKFSSKISPKFAQNFLIFFKISLKSTEIFPKFRTNIGRYFNFSRFWKIFLLISSSNVQVKVAGLHPFNEKNISVKIVGNELIVNGYEQDADGRHFSLHMGLADEIVEEDIGSSITTDGALTLLIPKKAVRHGRKWRTVPITRVLWNLWPKNPQNNSLKSRLCMLCSCYLD